MGEAELQPEMEGAPVGPLGRDNAGTLDAVPQERPAESDRAEPDRYAGNRVLSLLFNIQGSVWRYIVRAGLISLIPSLLVSFFLAFATLGNEKTMPQFDREVGAVLLFSSVVIVSPVVETLLLGFGLWLLSFATRKPLRQALGSCVLWAVLHSLVAPLWGLVVVWPFFVFSCAYLAWRRRSWWRAMGVTCGIHMLQNLVPGILIAVT